MAIPIQFDSSNVPLLPHLVLATRSGSLIRELPITQVQFREGLTSGSEFSFAVYREACLDADGNTDDAFWNKIKDFRLAYCTEYDQWYELQVDMTESTDVLKVVTAVSLGEAELSQINVYGIEVNTETDIERDDYEPTVLYNPSDAKTSLIDRLLYKAPHYSVGHVDSSIAGIQRTFSFDGKTVYDCFSEVATEIGCLFLLKCGRNDSGRIARSIDVYDLEYHCPVCGRRGEYMPVCDNCGNETNPGYGDDTTIFVSRENLAQEITYSTDTDAVKNCFRLETGDDMMTAAVISCNPNGSQYLWYIPNETRADMSDELREKLADYDELYDYHQNEAVYTVPGGMRGAYNEIVQKYENWWRPDTPLDQKIMPAEVIGFPSLMKQYFDTMDFQLFLDSELMPSPVIRTTDAATEAAKLTNWSLAPVAVANVAACTLTTADSAVCGMAKCIIYGTYQIQAVESSLTEYEGLKLWTGKLRLTNYGNEEDTADTAQLTIEINDDLEKYIQQKIDRMINQTEDRAADITALFELEGQEFADELKKYCRQRLNAFRAACQAALDVLIQQGVADRQSWVDQEHNLYDNMYIPYREKMAYIDGELHTRNAEIETVAGKYDSLGGLIADGMQTVLNDRIAAVHEALDFEAYIGEELWKEFASYRREDLYKNDNYISDGLDNYTMMLHAEQFMDRARQDIYKSAMLQHTIDSSLNNLLAMEEFQPIVRKFRVGNWIRLKMCENIYRLRLSEYTINYENWNLNVTFTDLREGYSSANDLQNILDSMKSMSTSYPAVARQATDGEEGKTMMERWANEGLALTTRIVGGAENQEFIMDETGFTGKELIPETGEYADEQIKITANGFYMTNDRWRTVRAAVGHFRFWNPRTRQEEDGYGVIADKLVSNVVLTQDLGIYNKNNSVVINENGFTLITEDHDNTQIINIKRHNSLDDSYQDILTIDASGNLVLQAYSTTDQMNAAIRMTAESIMSEVHEDLGEVITSPVTESMNLCPYPLTLQHNYSYFTTEDFTDGTYQINTRFAFDMNILWFGCNRNADDVLIQIPAGTYLFRFWVDTERGTRHNAQARLYYRTADSDTPKHLTMSSRATARGIFYYATVTAADAIESFWLYTYVSASTLEMKVKASVNRSSDVVWGYLYEGTFYSDSQHTEPITPDGTKLYIDHYTLKEYHWIGTIYTEKEWDQPVGSLNHYYFPEAYSRITQNADSIMTEVARANTAEGTLSTRITQNAENITLEASRARTAEGELSASIQVNAGRITAEVTRAQSAEGNLTSRIEQEAGRITSEVSRATGAEGNLLSRIEQNASDITLKVSKNGVIAAINLSTETSGGTAATINASKINLTGYVTISSLGASGTTTVNGSRIHGGTLTLGGENNGNGSLVIKDANNNTIVTGNNSGLTVNRGTISGPTIYVGGSNNGNGALYVRDANNNIVVTLDNYGITTTAISATDYVNFDCSSSSYLKMPFYGGDGYFELSSLNGFVIYSYGTRIEINGSGNLATDGELHVDQNVVVCTKRNTGITCYGYLEVSKQKNRVVRTEDFGNRCLSALETPTPMFTDIGTGTIDDFGSAYIFVEDIFAETVDTEIEYQVTLQKYGNGDCWVSKRTPSYFLVSGTPGLNFCWAIYAKQREYDQERLSPALSETVSQVQELLDTNLDEYAAEYIKDYYNEIESNEGSLI